MKYGRQLLLTFLLCSFHILHSQPLDVIRGKTDSTAVSNMRFDFKSIAEPASIEEKVLFYVEHIALKDTDAVYRFTDLKYGYELISIRSNLPELYSILDTAEIGRHLHFLDINNDGQRDCIFDGLKYDGLMFGKNFSFIVMLNERNGFRHVELPGCLITNFVPGETVHFETFSMECCDAFRHYYQLELSNGKVEIKKDTYIPRSLIVGKLILEKKTVTLKGDHNLLYDRSSQFCLFVRESCEPPELCIVKDGSITSLAQIRGKGYSWYLVETSFSNMPTVHNRRIIGWIQVKD